MISYLTHFAVIACLIVFFRFLKYIWTAPICVVGTDIELERTIPRTMMYLLNFPGETNARRASGFLGYFFSDVESEALLNGRWNVECKRRVKPRRSTFLMLNLVANFAAIVYQGSLTFVGVQMESLESHPS
ncbi:hypothetical protein [Massilia sp. CF038]|uniref:hypothetical protein n=1 Tax=Massilia sp. CF038 TaxID=1881045 RepID=UPI000934E238|nr:hypothetical protein [Massilia sp. CF038]